MPNPERDSKSTKDNHLAVVLDTNREYSDKEIVTVYPRVMDDPI